MHPAVLIAIVCGMILLRLVRPNALGWASAWWMASWVGLRFGIDPPLPSSVIVLFMFIVTISLLAYLTTSDGRMKEVADTIITYFVDRRLTIPLVITLVTIPGLVAFQVYINETSLPDPPLSVRTIHPAPPDEIAFRGNRINLVEADNPFRDLETTDPDAFSGHVRSGGDIYYRDCLLCHGADLDGAGLFAHGFDPIPANFRDPGTIAVLQESYLFWRIAEGAPGLPVESAPWSSSMPAWEPLLTEEEIWDVILYLYDYTGQRPRAREVIE